MKKVIAIAIAVVFVVVLGVPAVFAGNNGQAGASNTAHLYMYQKYLDSNNVWQVYPGGAWGKMTYFMSGTEFSFVMNGHKLAPGTDYTLIYYPDPWPGHGLIGLGVGTADAYGDVTIQGAVDIGNLPAPWDLNAYASTTTYKNIDGSTGAKIWLVLSSDVDCGARMMTAWTTTQIPQGALVPYLFESALIKFVDTGPNNVATLNLWQKNTGLYGGGDWSIKTDGASGILYYNLAGPTFDFFFDGQTLTPGTGYTLIYYPDLVGNPWPHPVTCLGTGTADASGGIRIAGTMNTGSLPASTDLNANSLTTTYPNGVTGAKIWLVLSGDISVSGVLGWAPSPWLFEGNLISYTCTP